MSVSAQLRPTRKLFNARVSPLVPSILGALFATLAVWIRDNHAACDDNELGSAYLRCYATHTAHRITALYTLSGWALVRDLWVYNAIIVFLASAGTTALGWAVHLSYLRKHQRGEFRTVGGAINPPITAYDLVRFFAYNPAAAWPLYAWMIYFAGSGLVTTRFPTLGDVVVSVAMLPVTFVVFDVCQYAGHRWMHATKVGRAARPRAQDTLPIPAPALDPGVSFLLIASQIEWIREMHMEHHRSAPQMEGLVFTDLMATNPFECVPSRVKLRVDVTLAVGPRYWINFNPGCMLVLEIFKHGLPMLGITGNWWGYWFNIVCLVMNATVGHLNYDVPQYTLLSSLGFGSFPDHSMHHYNPRKNFANYSVWLDKLMGTHEAFPADVAHGAAGTSAAGAGRVRIRRSTLRDGRHAVQSLVGVRPRSQRKFE